MRPLTPYEEFLKSSEKASFPGHGKVDYWNRYKSVAEYLENEVHPLVQAGAIANDSGFLTDHGIDHILTVQRRANDLVPADSLEPYEVYLFLLASQFHDAGNVFGRHEHEKKVPAIQKHLGSLMGDDAVEKRAATRIAEAHTGVGTHGKDTIASLPTDESVLHFRIRIQSLAALLRLADELADDSGRASRFGLEAGLIPPKSEIFHQYALALHSVRAYPDTRSLTLSYDFTREVACRTFKRGDEDVYLLDEIHRRTLKLHTERSYCMRYLIPLAIFHAIKVDIRVFETNEHPVPLKEIGYRLQDVGYPQPAESIEDLCAGQQIDGTTLHRELSRGANGKK